MAPVDPGRLAVAMRAFSSQPLPGLAAVTASVVEAAEARLRDAEDAVVAASDTATSLANRVKDQGQRVEAANEVHADVQGEADEARIRARDAVERASETATLADHERRRREHALVEARAREQAAAQAVAAAALSHRAAAEERHAHASAQRHRSEQEVAEAREAAGLVATAQRRAAEAVAGAEEGAKSADAAGCAIRRAHAAIDAASSRSDQANQLVLQATDAAGAAKREWRAAAEAASAAAETRRAAEDFLDNRADQLIAIDRGWPA